LRDETRRKRSLGLGLGLVRRIGKLGINRLRHLGHMLRVADPDRIPTDLPLLQRAGLVEIVVSKEETGRVRALLGTIIDSDNVEFPRPFALARPDRRGQRHTVADLPSEPLHQRAADDRAGPRLAPRLSLVLRQQVLGKHRQEGLGLDGKTAEPVLRLVLIDPVEPGPVRRGSHAGNALHAGAVDSREGHDERNLVANDEPVRVGQVDPGGKRFPDRAQQTIENEGHADREHRQQRAQLLPLEIAPDEEEESHVGCSA